MKANKMIMGFAFVGLLLFLCSTAFSQTPAPQPDIGAGVVDQLIDVNESNIQDGIGVIRGPSDLPIKKYMSKDGEKPGGQVTRVPPKPSYATVNVTEIKIPGGDVMIVKVPSELDNEPVFINTGNPDLDVLYHIKALNDWFGYDEVKDAK